MSAKIPKWQGRMPEPRKQRYCTMNCGPAFNSPAGKRPCDDCGTETVYGDPVAARDAEIADLRAALEASQSHLLDAKELIQKMMKQEAEPYGYCWYTEHMEYRFTRGKPLSCHTVLGELKPVYERPSPALEASQSATVLAAPDADEIKFNATRLRNVVRLVGLESAVPQDDADLLGCMGAVLGQVAGVLRERAAPDLSVRDAALEQAAQEADHWQKINTSHQCGSYIAGAIRGLKSKPVPVQSSAPADDATEGNDNA